jgi:pilus assembly protein CpaB
VVETVSMNDLRYNMYGGARYPAPAVVGGLANSVAGAFRDTSAQIARRPSRSAPAKKAAPQKPSIEVYRGTKSDQYKVGGQ